MGKYRACEQYQKTKSGVKRCKSFAKGRKYPTCKGLNPKNLRSAALIHPRGCEIGSGAGRQRAATASFLKRVKARRGVKVRKGRR